jgi:hypothetical protein
MVEATAIGPGHRTTPADLGIWNEDQVAAHRRLASFIAGRGAVPGIQLLAAGRKASYRVPWEGAGQNSPASVADGGWEATGRVELLGEETSAGYTERSFLLHRPRGPVSGVLWSPQATKPRATALLFHGGSSHKHSERHLRMGSRLA